MGEGRNVVRHKRKTKLRKEVIKHTFRLYLLIRIEIDRDRYRQRACEREYERNNERLSKQEIER